MVSFPYYSHIFRDSYGSGMGIVWEAYHKGVPLLGVPENPIDKRFDVFLRRFIETVAGLKKNNWERILLKISSHFQELLVYSQKMGKGSN